MADHQARARAALEHAFNLIREAHEPRDSDTAEVHRVACELAQARGYMRPDAIVAFTPQENAIGLIQPDGQIALALLAQHATLLPVWKLFEADARTAINAVRPPAEAAKDIAARALLRAFAQKDDMHIGLG